MGGVAHTPRPRRGFRAVRKWATADGAPAKPPTVPLPAEPPADPYAPRRRYPWHDDPDYDPAAHRRTPPPQAQWAPPAPHGGGWAPAPPTAWGPPAATPGRESGPPTPATGWVPAGAPASPTTAAGPGPAGAVPPSGPLSDAGEPSADRAGPPLPRKITVTRVAAMRSRQIAGDGIRAFRRATTADGADRSGLTALTYATMMTYAVDAAVAVALANTLFFAAAKAESVTNVALYLAITAAPFAVVAPVIGPLLDRLQRGRRAALAISFAGRAVLAVVMAFQYHTWLLYPAALGMLVLSKSFVVLKAAVTPRVLPSAITLVTTNSRLTTFGLLAGGFFGAITAGVAYLLGSPGALAFTAALAVGGFVLCLRIPRWVESTAGEVPAQLRSTRRPKRQPVGRGVALALWANGSIRVLTGFLTLFVAFVVRAQPGMEAAHQLFLIGIVGAAAGAGSLTGNAVGSRSRFAHSDGVLIACVASAVAVATLAAVLPGIATAAAVGLVGGTVSALAKVALDAAIQRDLPEESRASAFGRSETVIQLAWVSGGALGVLLPHDTFWIGFTVVAVAVALPGLQTVLISRGRSLLPFLGPRPASVG
jgi:MFS family permease